MIPMALLSGSFLYRDGRKLEISFTKIEPTALSFRLPKGFSGTELSFESLRVTAFDRHNRMYHSLSVEADDFKVEKSEEQADWCEYRICVLNLPAFSALIRQVSRDYLTYIEDRLTCDEAEVSAKMVGYPLEADAVFPENTAAFLTSCYAGLLEASSGMSDCPGYGLFLEGEADRRAFLAFSKDRFIADYWKSRGLEAHPLAKGKLDMIVMGSCFCPHREGTADEWQAVYEKCRGEGLDFCLAIAPVSESLREAEEEKLRAFHQILSNHNNCVDLLAGDAGFLWFLEKAHLDRYRVSEGILMRKKLKDPRTVYLNRDVSSASYDTVTLSDGTNLVWAPFYQTNTGAFCPYHSLVKTGSRGSNDRVTACDRICESGGILYPTHLKMLGRGNTLMGFQGTVLERGEAYRAASCRGKVVINLIRL